MLNLFIFWEDKVRRNFIKFEIFPNLNLVIQEIDKILAKLEPSKIKEEFKQKFGISENGPKINLNDMRTSLPLNYLEKKNTNKKNKEARLNETPKSSTKLEAYKSTSPTRLISSEMDDNDSDQEEKVDKKYFKHISNNKIIISHEFKLNNSEKEEDKNEKTDNKDGKKTFLRFSTKKSVTVSDNSMKVNNFEFIYQEELEDNNYITKIKKKKSFLNFIDIDLFLQYIAIDKKFYEDDEENDDLIEGFCLQYQTFIFPETLINKVISCFDYFYSEYLKKDDKAIEEKEENEEEEKIGIKENKGKEEETNKTIKKEKENEEDKKNNNEKHRRNAFKIRKRLGNSKRIPFGLIDFINTFIHLHNTYNHNELSHDAINKIYDFLKKLQSIEEIKEMYEKRLELAEIDLKEYEASIKKFEPKIDTNEEKISNLSSSEDSNSEGEEEDEKKEKLKFKDDDEKNNINQKENQIGGKNNEKKEYEEKENMENKKLKNQKEEKKENENEENEEKKEEEEENEDELKQQKSCKIINLKGEDKSFDNNKSQKTVSFSCNKAFKLTSSKLLNTSSFLNIYVEQDSTKIKNPSIGKSKDKSKGKSQEKSKNNSKNKKEKNDKEDKEKPYELDILKYKTQDIASELARVNYSLFCKIKVKEFLKGAFNGKDKYKSSPHILQIIKRFNILSSWVIEEILAYDHALKRAQILLKFIYICIVLKKIGDFDDLLSIMTGLTNYNISKLYKTWGHIPSADMTTFRNLKKLLSFEDNWKNLRNEIQKRIEEKNFFIPYLGYYTKRLIYLEEMGPYIKKNTSLINLEKIVEVYKVLKSFYQIKNIKNMKYVCEDKEVKNDLLVLQCLEPSNEDFLIQTSNLLEPKFILSNKKLNIKRRTKTDINYVNNIKKLNFI